MQSGLPKPPIQDRLWITSNIPILIAFCSLLTTVFLVHATKVDDLDLWWHLKTGEYIFKNHAIPAQDPFSFSSNTPAGLSEAGKDLVSLSELPSDFNHWEVNLNHSWLGQLVFYLVYKAGGLSGITLLKSLIFISVYLVLYLAMLREKTAPALSFLVICLTAYIGVNFNYSRPQLFSFLFYAGLFYIFYDFKRGGRLIVALPALMIFWANIHAGFVMGVITLLIFTVGQALEFTLQNKWRSREPKKLSGKQIQRLLLFTALTVLASLLNPNYHKIFLVPLILKQSLFFSFIEEYHRPMLYEYHGYWFMLLTIIILTAINFRRISIAEFFLVLYLIYASQFGVRAIIFFTIGNSILVAVYLTKTLKWLNEKKWLAWFRVNLKIDQFVARSGPGIILMALSVAFLIQTVSAADNSTHKAWQNRYPLNALDFIKENKLPARLLNNYNWGGYLIWFLPEYQVFIDGRCLNETAFFHYNLIMSAREDKKNISGGEIPLWHELLDAYKIQFILTSGVSDSGQIVPLVTKLSTDPGWQLIYQDGTAVIFLRDNDQNNPAFKHLFLPKKQRLLDEIISECQKGIELRPSTWRYYETLGMAYLEKYELKKAEKMFAKYYSMNPNNLNVTRNLNFLRNLHGSPPLPESSGQISPHKW